MTGTSESYNLQRMPPSQSNSKVFGRFDPIHIGLAVAAVVFLILSIVFIILFATKHDSSSGFLATGFTLNSKDDLSNDFQSRLKKQFTVNSFALDVQNGQVNSVFSLRDSVSAEKVQSVLAESKMVTQLQTTYGDKAYSVCHQQPVLLSTPQSTATNVPGTTPVTPVNSLYCKGAKIQRDVVIVYDLDDNKKINKTQKVTALTDLKQKIMHGINFADTNVFLAAVIGSKYQSVSTVFASDVKQFSADYDKLLALDGANETASFDFGSVINGVASVFPARAYTPGELIVVTDKYSSGAPTPSNILRDNGIYVTVAGINTNYVKTFATFIDQSVSAETWDALVTLDPFSVLVCAFYNKPAAAAKLTSEFMKYPIAELDVQPNVQQCEVLDVIIAFDTSESLSRIILDKYKAFAKQIVAQYKYRNDEFTRVGILTFNSDVTEPLLLKDGNSLDTIKKAIDNVQYTAGLTDVTKVLATAKTVFQSENLPGHGQVLIVLSDAVPTVDTYADEIKAGQDLAQIGVAVFFVGYSSYTPDVLAELGKVTNPNYVFGDMSDATFTGVTNQIAIAYPCPLPKCVTAYFAIEISEATGDYVVKNLNDILAIATKDAVLQTGTESYQLISYNEDMTRINPIGDASFEKFRAFVQGLIDNPDKRNELRGGNTRLDTAIDDISAELSRQSLKNSRFTANILFFGQANDAVLDPGNQNKRALLQAASQKLQAQTGGLIYVVDDSRPTDLFGDDLWSSVTTADRIFLTSDNIEASLELTDYYTNWAKLSCQLPTLGTCYDTLLDIAIVMDLQKKDDAFVNYITQFASSFSSDDDTHIGLAAYGAQKTMFLSNLAAHTPQDLQNAQVTYEEWRNGSLFITTTPPPTTTTVATTTTTSKKPQLFYNNYYQVDSKTVTSLFDTLKSQFGCPHYSDDGDRLFVPNLFIIASDNFDTYTPDVWNQFQDEVNTRFGCYDCAGTPTFLFLSRTDAKAPVSLGVTINLSNTDLDIDASDDTSTQANINKFNALLNRVCITPLIQCSSYTCYRN